ncbi:MAG TPA: MoxR family ATPase [Bacillota bacterium]|nr:MoxR family ATPase [Bacillota bacterium]
MIDKAANVIKEIEKIGQVRDEIRKVIVGQAGVVDLTLMALLCEGHVLLEGVPGLGKTMLVRSLAESLDLEFVRIQFTPDLMPVDILGTSVAVQNRANGFDLRFEPGPVFANLVLADEINRASPKTQAALLESMQERSVTVHGERHLLPRPFLVLATQNPLEMEGTYPLPEAQIDRFFFKILVGQPSEAELVSIIERTVGPEVPSCKAVLGKDSLRILQNTVREIVLPTQVASYAARLVMATQPEQASAPPDVRRFVRYGAGPRGAQALILAGKARALMQGRFNVSFEDIREIAAPALRHRVALNYDGQSEGIVVDQLLAKIMETIVENKNFPSAILES